MLSNFRLRVRLQLQSRYQVKASAMSANDPMYGPAAFRKRDCAG
jgi:hypothetical protein